MLEAAVACLAELGFRVPLATLAARAQLGQATVLRPFRTKQALLDATAPYVLTQLTAPVLAHPPQPGETLYALLNRWWEATAVVALQQPASFACWRLWRGATAAPPAVRYGPFAPVRALLPQAMGPMARYQLLLPPPAVVLTLAAQWLVALALAGAGAAVPVVDLAPSQGLRQALFAQWWGSTGLAATLAAVPSTPRTALAVLQQHFQLPPTTPALPAVGDF